MNYFEKYIKYKRKYFNLLGNGPKRNISQVDNVTENNDSQKQKLDNIEDVRNTRLSSLYFLFTTEKLYTFSHSNIQSRNTNTNTNTITSTNDTQSKQTRYNLRNIDHNINRETTDFIYGSYTPQIIENLQSNMVNSNTIEKLVRFFKQDDIYAIDKILENDESFYNIDNYGKVIECWISDNMKCPCCNQLTLKRYVRDNMPCIDLMCVNPEHKFFNGVKFFQVKAKMHNVAHEFSNFNLQERIIKTGSKNIGKYVHNITINDEFNMLLFGYICVEYKKVVQNTNEFVKILSTSFIVLPDINKYAKKKLFLDDVETTYLIKENYDYYNYDNHEKDELYFWYLNNNDNDRRIEFNVNNNQIILFNTHNVDSLFINKNFKIDTNYIIYNVWNIIANPLNL